jgi:plasmid stability protein
LGIWNIRINVVRMAATIKIRHVPEELHSQLKSRAASQGLSLSAYLRAELARVAEVPTLAELRRPSEQPTLAEWFERLRRRMPVDPDFSTAEVIRELRGPLRVDDPTRK